MEFQTVLIGSGVAAASVARTLLTQDPNHSLLVLEAGPRVPSRDRRAWWNHVVQGRSAYEHCHDLPLPTDTEGEAENESIGPEKWVFQESRMLGFGGSTFHWGGWSLRFKKEDFKLFSATGRGADWPIDYDELESFYCDAEDLLGVSGADPHGDHRRSRGFPLPPFPMTLADGPMCAAFDALGIRYAPMPIARFRKCMTTGTCKYCPFGSRFTAAYVLDDLLTSGRHPNLVLRTRWIVSELLVDTKARVAGVRCLDAVTGRTQTLMGQRFVICCGAIESPKLLLRSKNRHWPKGVGNDNELVGKHVISHPFLYARGTMASNPDRLQQELDFPTLMSRHYDTEKEQADGKLFLFRDRSKPRIDLAVMMQMGKSRAEIQAAVSGPAIWELQGFMEEFANPANFVGLGHGLNRLGLPQTRISFSRADGFQKSAQVRLGWMQEVLKKMGLTLGEAGVQVQRGDHVASTCRMSEKPADGVVTKDLRVHDLENLFVCSNAVFPSGAAVNPTLTLTALALRLGRHLCEAA